LLLACSLLLVLGQKLLKGRLHLFLDDGTSPGAPVRPVDVLPIFFILPCPPSIEAFAATLGVSSNSLFCTFSSDLCSRMITFFPLVFQLDLTELALLDCLTQECSSERDYDRLAWHEKSNNLH
jgi:hypothetical protein